MKQETQPSNLAAGQELKEYQLEALNWLIHLHSMNVNGILADEMGLGKTIQTISLLAYLHLHDQTITHLIIVPKVTIKNWERELNKWLPNMKVCFFYGDKEERKVLTEQTIKNEKFDVILTTFECAMKEKFALAKLTYEYLIIDEAHRIKNDKAKFSLIVRQFNSRHRLLLTGTPLQNNLHELWSLLNFLMPNIFNDSEEFDRVFNLDSASQEEQLKIVKQIHQLLRPFVLRRLKSEIEFKLPPKKEIYLYVGLSKLQRNMYKKILSKNIDVVNGVTKDRIQLLNILMQLKKVCNHPYLFPNIEEGPPYIEGEHLVNNSMKLKVLDVLLKKIHNEGNKVLIFSQMTTLLNILDDYCRYRGFQYVRIDGQTSSEDRDIRIEDFQSPTSDKWIFLISTRAGGLGINLHAANIVILYDSDWNPQVDLQAIDRAHRIGQTKPVTVYRFVCEGTVEEKIVERAAKKLKIDHLIIQKGKNVQNKVSAVEMTKILQYGADKIISQSNDEVEENIEKILEYSINKTEAINLKTLEEKININNLSLNAGNKDNIYEFDGQDYRKKNDDSQNQINTFVSIADALGVRERKIIHNNLIMGPKKPKLSRTKHLEGWYAKAGGGYIHQFYDRESLDYLDEKEKKYKEYLKLKETGELKKNTTKPEEFTSEDEAYRNELIKQGFMKWTKKDFSKFLRAAEVNGLNDPEMISKMMKTKTTDEVSKYIEVFKKRIDEFPNGERIMAKINKFESEKNKINEYQMLIEEYFMKISNEVKTNVYDAITIPYKDYKVKNLHKDLFDEEEDKYLMCLMFKYGYRNWNPIKFHILMDPFMKFNLNMKMKSEQELLDRANYLIMCLKMHKKKELERQLQAQQHHSSNHHHHHHHHSSSRNKSAKRKIKKVVKKKKKKGKK